MPRKDIWLTPAAVVDLELLKKREGLTASAVIQKALAAAVKRSRL